MRELVAAAFQQFQTSLLSRSAFPSGPGTFSGPRLTTPYPRGQRFLAPPYRFPVSASRTTGRTCARPRTTTDALLIITPYWCTVSNRVNQSCVPAFLTIQAFVCVSPLFSLPAPSIPGYCRLFWIIFMFNGSFCLLRFLVFVLWLCSFFSEKSFQMYWSFYLSSVFA